MHLFFGFPLQWGPLSYMVVLSACSLLCVPLAIVAPAPVAVGLVEVGILLAVARYCFRIIQQTSQGLLHSRDFMPDFHGQGPSGSLPWKLLGVLLVWGVVAGLLARISPALSIALHLTLSFAMPAIVITLAQDESFGQSINPGAWWRVIRGVGWSYVVLVLFTLMLSQGTGSALELVAPRIPRMLLLPAGNAVVIYFTLVTASMLGYVMYQHHEALGVDLQRGPGENRGGVLDADAERTREADRHVSEMVTSGNLGHAMEVACEAQRMYPEDLQAHARYHQVLTLMSDKNEKLGHHASRYIPLLLRKDLTSRAVEVFNACRERGVGVVLDNPDHLLAVARHQWRQGAAEAAMAAVRDFETVYPGHAQVPAALEFQVRVLVQGLHQKDRALGLVKVLEARYPTSPHTEEARWLVR